MFLLVRSESLDITLVNEVSTVRDGSKTYLKCVIKDVDLGYDPFKRVFDTGWLSVTDTFLLLVIHFFTF